MTKKQTLVVNLRRYPNRPWGISIAGGSDLGTPIIVTRSENDELRKGDVIKKIDDYDCRDVRHVDAHNLLQNSESVRLVVERSEPLTNNLSCNRYFTPQSSIVESIYANDGAAYFSLPKTESQPKILPKSPIPPPVQSREFKAFSSNQFDPPQEHVEEVREERFYLSQPYRTTPLVLPGAKIRKDAPLAECYLRHHPNPMIRAAPHHYEIAHPEVAMKQKVVHKQFNSPIGLYSEQNIADTIKCQASAIPAKKPAKYDPSKSEAYKALQEEEMDEVHEVSQPTRAGLFAPQKAHHNRVQAPPKSPASSYASGFDDDGEKIHQSNSFKRIMFSVLGQTDY